MLLLTQRRARTNAQNRSSKKTAFSRVGPETDSTGSTNETSFLPFTNHSLEALSFRGYFL